MTFISKLDLYFLQTHRVFKYTSMLSKAIISSDRQTETTEITLHAASRVVKNAQILTTTFAEPRHVGD